jgi:CheY-like chemotaxis protein
MIDDLGHTAIEAHSAAEALAKLDSGIEVDVVITDHAMPSMTGLQLAECIRDRFPGLPVILATGYAELPADPAKLGLLKLTKPCTQQEIAAAIYQAVASRRAVKAFPGATPAAARG